VANETPDMKITRKIEIIPKQYKTTTPATKKTSIDVIRCYASTKHQITNEANQSLRTSRNHNRVRPITDQL